MKNQEIKNELIDLYRSTLNKSSKFYQEDLNSFTEGLKGKSEKELEQQLANMNALCGNSASFNKKVESEINRMNKAGMFNPSSLNYKNSLS